MNAAGPSQRRPFQVPLENLLPFPQRGKVDEGLVKSAWPQQSVVKNVSSVGGHQVCDVVGGARSNHFHRSWFRVRPSSVLQEPDLVVGRCLPTESVSSMYATPSGAGRGLP